jgi:hypothetical protein
MDALNLLGALILPAQDIQLTWSKRRAPSARPDRSERIGIAQIDPLACHRAIDHPLDGRPLVCQLKL